MALSSLTTGAETGSAVFSAAAGCTGQRAGGRLGFAVVFGAVQVKQVQPQGIVTTQKLERLMAEPPNMGFRVRPKGMNTPAASGMPMML